ncbi:hypothetical protein AB4278_24020, partial [Vibrio splendidus]
DKYLSVRFFIRVNNFKEVIKLSSIPQLTKAGLLPPGIHNCSGEEFLRRFCETSDHRILYHNTVSDVFDYAKAVNAQYVFVGGSFVTDEDKPADFDAVIVLKRSSYVANGKERLNISGQTVDVMFCAEDEPKLVDSLVYLLSRGKFGEEKGVVQVNLFEDKPHWKVENVTSEDQYKLAIQTYNQRSVVSLEKPKGILVTIHGINTTAAWNSDVMPIFSSKGWIVAPFNYGFQLPNALVDDSKRKEILNSFRDWIHDIKITYNAPISIIAHSFGTYIIGKYLAGFDERIPVEFESIILTGSILNEEYDWEAQQQKVGRVRNEIAPNDQWVKWMPNKKILGLDTLFGKAGVNGFYKQPNMVTQYSNTIFDHNNMIKKDVIEEMWLPFIENSKVELAKERIERLKSET